MELIKHTLLAKDKVLNFHPDNFFFILNLATIGSHVLTFLGLAPIGIPRYTKGRESNLLFNTSANLSTSYASTTIALNRILKKFTFKPNTSSRHLNIFFNCHDISQ